MARPNSARQVDAAQRDAQALELRAAGANFRQIADRLGVSVSTAWKCVDRGLAATRQEPAAKLRTLERDRLDRLTVQAVEVLQARHVVVSGGKIITDDDGRPLVDHGPTLAAINTLVRLMERRARLEGLDEPARADITAKVHAEVYSVSALDRELERVTAELAAEDPEWGVAERRRQDLDGHLVRFRGEWSTPGQITRDPARFVGDGLAMLLETLDLDDQAREAAVVEVEHFLMSGQASP
jgi:hypothetical protein